MFTLQPPESLISSQMLQNSFLNAPSVQIKSGSKEEYASSKPNIVSLVIEILEDNSNDNVASKQHTQKKMKNKVPLNFVPKQKDDLQCYNVNALKKFGEILGMENLKICKRNELEKKILRHFSVL